MDLLLVCMVYVYPPVVVQYSGLFEALVVLVPHLGSGGIVWYGMVWYGAVEHSMVWYSMAQ